MPAEGSGAGKKWYKWHFIAVTFSKSELRGELGRTRELTDSTPTLVTLCISTYKGFCVLFRRGRLS